MPGTDNPRTEDESDEKEPVFDVVTETYFRGIEFAEEAGYKAFVVILFLVNGQGQTTTLFYAKTDDDAFGHCRKVFSTVRYRVYRLELIDYS